MSENSNVETFLQWVKESDNIVFFGGAGVSTESGIPDFRSVDGLYNQKYDYPPETILSHTFYRKKPEEFYRFYRDKMLCLDAEPNITHKKLAELEKTGKLKGIVTQNIDGLHQKAGSKNVMELHGSVLRNYCERCLQFVSAEDILHSTGVPKCPKCGGPVKPDVVLYEEGLNQTTLGGCHLLYQPRGCADRRRNVTGGISGSRSYRLLHRQQASAHQQINNTYGCQS